MATTKTVSREGLLKLEQDLEYLITVKRSEVAEKLKEARSFGDLSENAEYDEAKNEQGILEARIAELETLIANVTVVDDDQLSVDEISVGSIVKVYDMDFEEEETFQIVGSTESDPDNGKISDESPIGKALLKKKIGEFVVVETPGGEVRFKVLDISK